MKLAEYLKIRGTKVAALSIAEGKTMGVDPTQSGWIQFANTAEVPQRLVDAALAGATSKQLRKIAREMNQCGFVVEKPPQNPPRPGSLAPLKKMETRHLLAATKHLQERGRLIEMGNKPASFVVVAREMHDIYKDSPGFVEKYGQGQNGLRRMVIDFFDDAPVIDDAAVDLEPKRPTKAERKRLAREAARRGRAKIAREVKARRSVAESRVEAGATTVEGVDVRSKDFLSTYAWTNLRIKALNLYGRKCMCCGDSPENGAVMNVDHIKPRVRNPELALDVRNTQILCQLCNKGKCNELETDYRSPAQIAAANAAALVM